MNKITALCTHDDKQRKRETLDFHNTQEEHASQLIPLEVKKIVPFTLLQIVATDNALFYYMSDN